MKPPVVAFATLLLLAGSPSFAEDKPKFELVNGDRVVLIGGTMIERDQSFGYLETRLTRRYPDRNITFRNLGWSGDTVEGVSRAGFGSPSDGFKQLVDHVLGLKPTVIFIGYGANESFEGKAGLPKFLADFDRLLKAIEPTKARLVFLSPTRQEDLGPPLPDPMAHNADLALYRDAIKAEAEKRGAVFVDLFPVVNDRPKGSSGTTVTNNSIHFNANGYWWLAAVIEKSLFGDQGDGVGVTVNNSTQKVSVEFGFGAKVEDLETTPSGLKFKLLPSSLPSPLYTFDIREHWIKVKGLTPGRYYLEIDGKLSKSSASSPMDGKPLRSNTVLAWESGITLHDGPDFDQVEALRRAINAKNELYFYRWRPQNETYLFGFRKHEQGQNAREIPLFDPLVEAKEAEIAKLRVPVPHVYELIREGEAGR